MATVVYGGRGRWRVLCRAAADVLASLQCRKHGALLLPTAHTPPSFLCSSSNAALKPEHFYRVERRPAAAEKETPLDKQTGSGRGGNSEISTSKKQRQKQNSPSQQSSQVSGGTQESEKVRQYLKGRLQLELDSDVTNQREVLLLCCTLSDVEERVERLLEAGFSEEWAAILLPLFPPLWDVDVTHMRRVLELLEERGFGGNALKKIVSEHSYLLMEDRQLIERRLNELLEMGIEQQQIVSIFTAHPLLFGFSLGRDTIHTIRELQGKHFGSKWVASALLHCLHFRPSKVSISPGVRLIMELLKELGVDPDDVMTTCPSFFGLDAGHLVGVVQVLCGRPLYLDTRDMHHMIQSHPELFIELCAIGLSKLQSHLDMLYELFPSIVKLIEMLKKTPGIVSAVDCELDRKVLLLKELGFTRDQLGAFIAKMPGFLVQMSVQDVEQRMRLFFSIADVTPQLILQSPLFSRLLSRKWEFLQTRYSYANKHNVSVLKATSLQQLFWSSDESFAQLCNQTLDHFHCELGARRETYMEGDMTPPPPPSPPLPPPHQHNPLVTTATRTATARGQKDTPVPANGSLVPGGLGSNRSSCSGAGERNVDCQGTNGASVPSRLPGEISTPLASEGPSSAISCVKLAPMYVFKPDGVPARWRSRNYATYLKKKKGVLTFTCPVCGHAVGSESGYGKHIVKHGSAYAFETPPLEWNTQFSH